MDFIMSLQVVIVDGAMAAMPVLSVVQPHQCVASVRHQALDALPTAAIVLLVIEMVPTLGLLAVATTVVEALLAVVLTAAQEVLSVAEAVVAVGEDAPLALAANRYLHK